MDEYRPIYLCNLSYKIITKLIASRFKPILDSIISSSQAEFIPNRSMMDNIIMSHEVIYLLNRKKGKVKLMAFKVDMVKAYDRVEWNFLCHVLKCHGFLDHFISMIFQCISTPSYSILVNRPPHRLMKPSRGIR